MTVALENVTVRFGEHTAVNDVSLVFRPGTVHAVVGENGAGKSTAMNVLFGLQIPDRGVLRIDGKSCVWDSPRQAIDAGLGMVHQHFRLVESMSVLENLILCAEPCRGGGFLDLTRARETISQLANVHGLILNPNTPVSRLSFGQRQIVEIAKVLYRQARVLVLDEPTAVLTPDEIQNLFAVLRALREEGRCIVLITHKLDEVMSMADDVSVMRAGRCVYQDTIDTSNNASLGPLQHRLAQEIVGRDLPVPRKRKYMAPGEALIELRDLIGIDGDLTVGPLSFVVRKHEIVAIAGVAGNGQAELIRVLTGSSSSVGGDFLMAGQQANGLSVAQRRKLGMSYIPEDRQRVGLALGASVAENAGVACLDEASFRRGPFLRRSALKERAIALIEKLNIKTPGPSATARTLSGGNQQKLVVARELQRGGELIIAENPTWGVDIGAIDTIHRALMARRDAGHGVLLISSELDEVLALADRVLVMSGGQLVGELSRSEASRQSIGQLMTGQDSVAAFS